MKKKPIKILKKPNRIQTEPNRKKQSQTSFVQKTRTETGRFEPIPVFFFFNFNLIIFLIKTKPNKKITTRFLNHQLK